MALSQDVGPGLKVHSAPLFKNDHLQSAIWLLEGSTQEKTILWLLKAVAISAVRAAPCTYMANQNYR